MIAGARKLRIVRAGSIPPITTRAMPTGVRGIIGQVMTLPDSAACTAIGDSSESELYREWCEPPGDDSGFQPFGNVGSEW